MVMGRGKVVGRAGQICGSGLVRGLRPMSTPQSLFQTAAYCTMRWCEGH